MVKESSESVRALKTELQAFAIPQRNLDVTRMVSVHVCREADIPIRALKDGALWNRLEKRCKRV